MATPGLTLTFTIQVGASVHHIGLAADGRRVAVAAEKGVFVFDFKGRQKFALYAREFPFIAAVFAQNGQELVAVSRAGQVYTFDLLADLSTMPLDMLSVFSAKHDLCTLSIADNCQDVLLGHIGERVTRLSLEGNTLWVWQPEQKTWQVAMDPSGQHVAAASMGSPVNILCVLDQKTGEPTGTPFLTQERVTGVAVLPSGEIVAAQSGTGQCSRLGLFSPDLTTVTWTYDLPIAATGLSVDAKGCFLAVGCGDGELFLFDLQKRALAIHQCLPGGSITGVAITGDGRHVGAAAGSQVHLLRNELLGPA